ncbi:MAG: cytidine deaminase [Phaeodactylibacter sp.]|nr:cytidine deaminase [Phaeodactylibacter sp.]
MLVYDEIDQLEPQFQQLLLEARAATHRAYAPYSNFLVGAAVLLEDGQIVTGANQENAAYPMCLCAERVTLAGALSQYPGKQLRCLAVTVRNPKKVIDQPASPCGACRQVIVETELRQQAPIRILMQGEKGPIYDLKTGNILLPLGFDASFL